MLYNNNVSGFVLVSKILQLQGNFLFFYKQHNTLHCPSGCTVITLCFRTPFVFKHPLFLIEINIFLYAQKHVFRIPFVFGHTYFTPK